MQSTIVIMLVEESSSSFVVLDTSLSQVIWVILKGQLHSIHSKAAYWLSCKAWEIWVGIKTEHEINMP